MTVQRVKRVAELGFVETFRVLAVVIAAETFPYWLLVIDRHYVTSISCNEYSTFDQIFDTLQEDASTVSLLRQLITRIGMSKYRCILEPCVPTALVCLVSGLVAFLDKCHLVFKDRQCLFMTTSHMKYIHLPSSGLVLQWWANKV